MVKNKLSDDNSEKKVPKPKVKSSSSDAEELKEIASALPELFGALNESIPKLISGLIGSVYSPEAAGNMAKGIGQFYSNLIAEGIPEEIALDMTKKFVGALDFGKLMSIVSDEASFDEKKIRKKKHSKEVDFDEEDEAFDEEFD
jgi:hypothetical protein